MPEILKASEQNLNAIFSDDYLFTIPVYQRPYAWTSEQVDELLDDLRTAASRDPNSPYFLGSIVLIKTEGSESDVVDGQQRLTTLTILFCVLRELALDDAREELDDFIQEKGNRRRGTQDRFRLSLGKRDRAFFRDNVQTRGALNRLLETDAPRLSDSQDLIRQNARRLRDELAKLSHTDREQLETFIIEQCYLVVVTATDRDSAYRIFAVMNDRGLDLSPTDILKADIIGAVARADQDEYGEKWEDLEDGLGREDFRDLFAHIRMIELKTKLRSTLQADFKEHVLEKKDANLFIDEVLEPLAEVYEVVTRASFESHQDAERVNLYLRHLGRLDNFDWVPPAMSFFHKNEDDYESILRFSRHLERLAYGLFIRRANINERINRYGDLLKVLEVGDDVWKADGPLQLAPGEKASILAELGAPIYSPYSRVMKPLLLRLDSALADSGAKYDYTTISIEHVLPQNPADDSEWRRIFHDDEEREYWTHRLANLVLLSFRKNARASNFDFARKKDEYFQRGGVPPFALTTQVVAKEAWTPSVLEDRQRILIDVLREEWQLGCGSQNPEKEPL